jgi:hypothetical protein
VIVGAKNPDLDIIKKGYFALAVFAELNRHYDNSLHAYSQLRSVAEGSEDYSLV